MNDLMKSIKTYIEDVQKLLPTNKMLNVAESERRAGEFLHAMAHITEAKHTLSQDKIKLMSVQTAVYAELLANGNLKTVTENKVQAEAAPAYITAREEYEQVENDISYLKTYYDIFNNAHIFYRNMARGENA
jgi:predicted RNA-binding protein